MVVLVPKHYCCCWSVGRIFEDAELELLYQQSYAQHRMQRLHVTLSAVIFFIILYGTLRISAAASNSQHTIVAFYVVNSLVSLLAVVVYYLLCHQPASRDFVWKHHDHWLLFYSVHIMAFVSLEYSQISQLLNVPRADHRENLQYRICDWISLFCTMLPSVVIPVLDASPYICWWLSVVFSPLYFLLAHFAIGLSNGFEEHEEVVPFAVLLCVMGLLIFANLWQHDEHKRHAFIAKRQAEQLAQVVKQQSLVIELLTASVCDATFRLSRSLVISDSQSLDNLLGKKVSGVSITKLLSEEDATRLKDHAEFIVSSKHNGLKELPLLCLSFSCPDGLKLQANMLLVEAGPLENLFICGLMMRSGGKDAMHAKSSPSKTVASTPIRADDVYLAVDNDAFEDNPDSFKQASRNNWVQQQAYEYQELSDSEESFTPRAFSLCLGNGATKNRSVQMETPDEFPKAGARMCRTPSRTPAEPTAIDLLASVCSPLSLHAEVQSELKMTRSKQRRPRAENSPGPWVAGVFGDDTTKNRFATGPDEGAMSLQGVGAQAAGKTMHTPSKVSPGTIGLPSYERIFGKTPAPQPKRFADKSLKDQYLHYSRSGKCDKAFPKHVVLHDERYWGAPVGSVHDGPGIHTWSDGSTYKGQWSMGKAHGVGCMVHSDGDKYDGQWYYGEANGEGVYIQSQGSLYYGQWDSDLKDGQGLEEWPDGARYEGAYVKGQKHGCGTFIWPNGSTYRGNFARDEMHGEGCYISVDGRWYNGAWSKSRMQGYGQYQYPGLGIYTGEYRSNLRHGHGIFTWTNGDRYEGQWNDDSEHGRGTMTYASGGSSSGTWSHGKYERSAGKSNAGTRDG